MSLNPGRAEKSEQQLRKPGRSGSSSQQRSFSGGAGKGGGGSGGTAPTPSSVPSTAPSLSNNRSVKKYNNGQGGQSRSGSTSSNSESNVAVATFRVTQNGAHAQAQVRDGPVLGTAKQIDSSVSRSPRVLPKAPSSQSTSGASDSLAPATSSKGDASRSFPFQFGSLSPGFMNGMQIPARTSSAPPNLDEQKRGQARHDSFKAAPTLSIPSAAPKPQQSKKDNVSIKQSSTVETNPPSQAKRDAQVQISAAPVASATQKSSVAPISGMSIPTTYQQPQIPLQFGGSSPQIQSQGVTAGSLQMTMPLPMGNASQVQQQVFVPGLQSHPLQPQGMMHHGFAPQMGHQLVPQLGNHGIGMAPQFTQQAGKFGAPRKAVKITHPETHEELKLAKRTDAHSDTSSSGSKSHPSMPPQSQPIQSFSPAHPMNYYATIQPNSYNAPSIFYPNPTSLPLTSTQMTPASSAARYNYPVGQGGPPISFINPSVPNILSSGKAGPPMHGVPEPSNLENARDSHAPSVSAQSASVRVTVKPAVAPHSEKVMTSVTVSPAVSKGELPLLRQPGEASVSIRQTDNNIGLASPKQPKVVLESLDDIPLPGGVKISNPASASASLSMFGLQSSISSVSITPAEESTSAVVSSSGRRRDPVRRSDSLKDQQRKSTKKELQLSQQQHQADTSDSAASSDFSLLKSSNDSSSLDLNARQASKNVQPPLVRVGEPTVVSSIPSPKLDSSTFFVRETEEGKAISSTPEAPEGIVEATAEVSLDSHSGSRGASRTVVDCDPSKSPGPEAFGIPSEGSDVAHLKKQPKQDVFASLDSGLKQETVVTVEHVNDMPGDNTEVHTRTVAESFEGGKPTDVPLEYGAIASKADEKDVVSYTSSGNKMTDMNAEVGSSSEVGRVVGNVAISSSASSVSNDAKKGPSSHIPTTDALRYGTLSADVSRSRSEESIPTQEVSITEPVIPGHESDIVLPSAFPEKIQKHEGREVESTSSGQTSTLLSVSKDKVFVEQNRTRSSAGKKKKRKENHTKEDAAGITSDLYIAYKGPEEKNETSISTESINGSPAKGKHEHVDDTERGSIVAEDDDQSKAEVDDWEDAAEMTTPKLKMSENGELIRGGSKHGDGYEARVTGKKKYTRDFLLTFSELCKVLPTGFENGSDIVDALMSGPATSPHLVDRESYTSSGRIIDRPAGGARPDRRGIGIVDDDKWSKAPGPFASGRDPRLDVTHGGSAVNFRPGQAGSHGVLRNPRGQSTGQYVGGILLPPGGMRSPDVDRWPRGTASQKGLIPAPQTPLQVMHKAEKKYEVGIVSDKEQTKQRQLKSILNKLTPQNFEKLFEQVKEVNIDSAVTLTGVISQIFDKALMEPTFCEMYADFCLHLAGELPDFSEDNEKITFKRLLLNKCQEEFERGEREQAEANRVEEEGEIKQSNEEREEKRLKARRRMLGNIRLIGELYKKKMLTERIMHECIKKLLGQYQNTDEEDIEALCKLMSTIGEMIDHPKAKEHMDAYFDNMLKLSNNQKLSSRLRFMLKDAIDLRKNRWQQRRKVEGPKKIEEVHRDAAQERQLQTSRLSRVGSGIGSARRGQALDFGPRGPTALSSPNAQQMSGPRSLVPQLRGFGVQDVRLEDRHPSESRMLSVPLPPRPIDDDSITLGPQGGLARGMSFRGQPMMPSGPLADVSPTTWDPRDPRRMVSGPNGYSSSLDLAPYNSREEGMSRYSSERFMAAAPHDQTNTLERNASFGNRDLGNTDRSIDRSMAALPATSRVQGSSGAQNHPPEPKMSEGCLRDMSIAAIREYYSARNEEEVRLCIKDLNSPSFYPDMVMLWVTDSFERKSDIDRDLLAKLLVRLCKPQDNLLSQVQLIKGFEAVLLTLEDAVTDSPKAAEYLGCLLGRVISENVVPLKEVGRLILEGGEEPGCLRETGLASDVLVSILDIIKQEKGDTILNEIRMSSNLRLEDFRPQDPIKSRKLDAFI